MEDDTDNSQNPMTGEEIVVTGMSGTFPKSESVQEFMENLYNKVSYVLILTKLCSQFISGRPIYLLYFNKKNMLFTPVDAGQQHPPD